MAPVGALGLQQLLGALGAGALGGGERGDGVQLCLVLVAEGVAFAGGVGAGPVGLGAGVGFGLPGAAGLGVGTPGGLDRLVTFAGGLASFGLRGADLPGGLGPGGGDVAGCVAAGLLGRGCGGSGFLAGGGGGGLGGADVLAGCLQGLGQGLGLGGGFAGAGPGGDGGGFGAAAGGLGLGDLGPDPGRVQAGGLLAGGPDEDGGLPDHALQRGQRVRGGIGGHGCRDGDAGVVVVAAGALVAAELPGAAAVLGGQDVSAARPLAEGCRGRAGLLPGGGIAGHDGTFRYQPLLFFSFLLRSEMKRKRGAAGDGDRGPGFLPGPAGRAGTGRVRTLRPCGPRFRRGAAGTTR